MLIQQDVAQVFIESQAQISDISKIHDWTIPDSQYITRPSLLKVVGVNDPENKGEVRISFGAFLAAGSEELGSLSRTSPGRPRPHFGDEKPILTPSPKGAFKLISEPTTPSDPFLPDNHSPDDLMNRPSVDGNTQESSHKVIFSPDETFQRPSSKEQWERKDVLGEEATKPTSPSTNMLSFEMQKMKLDEQFKVDGSVKKRSRSASQTSSSSTGSIQSVIKKSDGKGTQSGRSIGGSDSRTKDRKRSHRKEKPEHQNSAKLDASSRSKRNSEQTFEELSMSLGKMSTLRRSSCGDASYTSSLEQMTQFIAQAINEDPEEIRKKLAAVQKNKTKVKSKKREGPSSEDTTESTHSERSDFNPLASSSPQRQISPERITYSQVNLKGSQEQTLSDSPNRLSSYGVDDSVFPSEATTSMVPLSLKELGSKDASSQRESMPSPETRSFHHIIPQFGETYTVRRAKKQADQQQNSHMIDPRKHRTHEIEERLNRSLPQNMESSVVEDNVQHPLPSERHPSNHELSTSHTHFSPLGTSDSAVGSLTTVLTQDVTNTRHSWPEASPRHHQLQKDFSKVDHVGGKTHLSESKTKMDVSMNYAVPPGNFGAPVQPGNIGGGVQSNAFMHGHHTGNLGNHQLAQTGVPLSFAQGIAPFDNPSSATHIYPSHNINGPVGIPGMIGSMFGTKTFGMQVHGPLSRTAPTTYGPGMVPLASAMYPPQGLGTMNTLPGHVPFVQTVSASMGPKPSSLTPTYVQSLNVEIPQNFSNQQIPLHLQTNMSNISELPTSFTHPRVSTSMLHQHTPPQQVPNGLLQVRPNFSQGAVTAATQEIIPGEIKFPPFCCVGVLTESVIPLHNSSSRWMHCEIHFILSTANGVQLPSSASAFSVQSKAIIAPHTTENVRISIEPAEAGTYTAQLQIYSFPVVCDMQPVTHSLGPVLALEVVAEEPRVEILLEEENSINFGEVSLGAKQCRPIHLVNRGRAQVPIRLIISANSSSLHCFGFADADFSPKDGVRNLASVKGSALTIHTLTLKGRQEVTSKPEPTVVLLLFQSPKVGLNSGNRSEQWYVAGSSSAGPPEEYIARLDVEIDSARQGPTISSVALKAIEGVVRLHTPHKLQVLTLKSSVGKPSSCTIPVKNAGHITARVKLKIEGDTQQFSVKPDHLHLKPEEESEVQVTYQPAEANKQVQSLVVLAVPNGPVYELVVKGSATPKEEDKFTLLSSKPVLCWSGVALGWSQTQKVVLKTSSTSPVKLQLTIEGNHSDFQIQPTFSSHSGSPERHQSTLEPKKELPVHVSFSPSSMGLISSSLVIKSLTGRASSKIPLYGCGGTSQLVLVDVRQLSEGYIINIGEVSLGRKNPIKVRLRNSGTRAAFVKTVCYSDVHSLQQYPSTHLTVHPNNFILSERTSKTILIEYQPLERDAIKCRASVNSVAAVAFYTGDEFLRRQYKKNLQRNPQQQFSPESKSSGPLVGLNFTTTFQDEDKLIEDVKYPKVPNWTTFFQSSVSRVLLTLVGSPPSPHPGNANDPNRSVDTVPVSDRPFPKPQMNSPVMNGNLEEKSWAVIPDFLTMTPCKSQDDKSGKSSDQLRIVNFSERSLGFEFTWPGHAIVITPERGEIPPRSQTKVFVSAKPNPSNSLTHLPWVGTIYLNCDGVQQSIRVQIKEEQILESSPLESGALNFQSIPITASGGTPLPSHHLPSLRITNKDVMFGATLIGTVKTSEISLTNTAPSDVSWNLCSVAPAYVKVDDTGSIHRTTYNAFSIPKLSGSLQGHGTAQIVVKFQPRDVGEYEQSWDLLTSSGGRKSKQKIFLHGQAVDKISSEGHFDDDLPAKTKKVTIKEPYRSTVGDKKGLYITDGVLQFPVTKIGSISEAKINICNGSGEIQYLAHIASPTKPFSVNNKKFTIRPGRFVRLPVVFSPNEPGKTFETSLVITADPEAFLSVKLQGSSAE